MQQGLQYTVDIVICLDATGSMAKIIDEAKKGAIKFHENLAAAMEAKNKYIDTLRIKVVVFRDYYCDGAKAMQISNFFTLPEDAEAYAQFIRGVVADGGGDEPENGLEALSLAIRSDWNKAGDKRRQVIVVWTDASTHPLEKFVGEKPPLYPQDMPKDFNELTDEWEGQYYLNPSSKRLVLFAPDSYAWTDISNYWSGVIHYPSQAGNGLSDVDYNTILDVIANSV